MTIRQFALFMCLLGVALAYAGYVGNEPLMAGLCVVIAMGWAALLETALFRVALYFVGVVLTMTAVAVAIVTAFSLAHCFGVVCW